MDEPVRPVLASTLWAAQQRQLQTRNVGNHATQPSKVTTGLSQLDAALNAGFDYGKVMSLSSEKDTALGDLLNSILVTNLLGSPRVQVTVIVSTLDSSFDLARLHRHLLATVRGRGQNVDDAEAKAASMTALSRVRIIKVLDFFGAIEGLTELRTVLEENESKLYQEKSKPPFKSTISDSEDDSDAELSSPRRECVPKTELATLDNILLVDSLSALTSSMMKNNSLQGHALFESTMRSLTSMTRTHNLCTLVITDTTVIDRSKGEMSPSIFASCAATPRLGIDLANAADLSILLHMIPITVDDALVTYGTQAGNRYTKVRGATVIEILLDRMGDRRERWSAVEIDSHGKFKEL